MLSLPLVLAALSLHLFPSGAYEYSTAKICTTKYGVKSTSVKTSSYAVTIPVTVTQKSTSTPTSTLTPPPQTTTSLATTTTTSIVVTTPTDTFTETDFTTSTTTTTTTITTDTTTTTTSITSVATSTVPTPAGFTPLASEPGYVPKKRSAEAVTAPAIRGRRIEERATVKTPVCPQVGKPGSFSQYPQSVVCGALIVAKTTSTKVYTATKTATTTLPAATTTVISTVTETEISTSAAAPASTTITITQAAPDATETATSTSTSTSTQTVTIVQASSTVYAACSSNNVINHANGNQGIFQVYYTGGSNAPPTTNEIAISDPVACCEQCQKTSGCTGFAQYPGEARCFVFTQGQCVPSSNLGQLFGSSAGFAPGDGYTIGNGQCGQIGNGGSS
ncbi:MAG: hypothetical protein L6R41_005200 [Letrouitia leprolyta]|nr:MAG: hypothetical protein L6R41_005200 [Letrouitia leprolyta]